VLTVAEHHCPKWTGCGGTSLEAPRAAEPVQRRAAHAVADLWRGRGELLIVLELEPEHARRLHRPESARVEHPEGDRHLAEDVAGIALADHGLHTVDAPEHLDAARQHAEQRAAVALVYRELPGNERDVRCHASEQVELCPLD